VTRRFTILGCGSSGGCPRIGGEDGADWGVCDPAEPKNRRQRGSFLAERSGPDGVTRVLVDTSPDLREQLLDARVSALDAVLFSHDHADQTHGIDDLRPLTFHMGRRIPVYLDDATAGALRQRFGYCFETPPGHSYPPILDAHAMPAPGQSLTINGAGGPVDVTPLAQDHGRGVSSLGFRFGEIGYSNDVAELPDETLAALDGVRVWIVDALRYTPHPTHAHLDKALGWIDRLKPELAILTNLHVDMDYATLRQELPEGVIPAHDGLTVVLDGDRLELEE